jgi:hypothetical protein
MVVFMNWFLNFVHKFVDMLLFDWLSFDKYSIGYMLLSVTILGAVIMGTISAVGIFSRKAGR